MGGSFGAIKKVMINEKSVEIKKPNPQGGFSGGMIGQGSVGAGTGSNQFVSEPLTVMSDGQGPSVGFWASLTVTVKLQVWLVPTPFDAVQVTVVVPLAKAVPDAGLQVTVGTGQPVAVGLVKVVTAVQTPGSVFFVMFAGHAPMTIGVTTFVTSGAMVTGLKLDPVTLGPDPVAGLVTVQMLVGNGVLIVAWNITVTLSPGGMVPRALLIVSPLGANRATRARLDA